MNERLRTIWTFGLALLILGKVAVPAAHAQEAAADAEESRITMSSTGIVSVPMTYENGFLFANCMVNGKQGRFVLDTGANVIAVTPSAARRFGLRFERTAAVVEGVGGNVKAQMATMKRLTLGDSSMEMSNLQVAVVEFPAILRCDGILGAPLFANVVCTLDYVNLRLTITAPDKFTPPSGAVAIAMNPSSQNSKIPSIMGGVDDANGELILDTGFSGSVSLHAQFVAKHKLRGIYSKRIPTAGGGIGGSTKGEAIRAKWLILGDRRGATALSDVIVRLEQTGNVSDDEKRAGIIGNGIFERATVTFDYDGKTLYISPHNRWGDPFPHVGTGLTAELRSANLLSITAIGSGSPASEAGLRVGDIILKINDAPVTAKNLIAEGGQNSQIAGTKVTLLIRQKSDGKTRKVTLVLRDLL